MLGVVYGCRLLLALLPGCVWVCAICLPADGLGGEIGASGTRAFVTGCCRARFTCACVNVTLTFFFCQFMFVLNRRLLSPRDAPVTSYKRVGRYGEEFVFSSRSLACFLPSLEPWDNLVGLLPPLTMAFAWLTGCRIG